MSLVRRLFLENITLKAAAVVLAVILWFFVVSKGQMEMSLTVPIEYANIPSGIEIARHEIQSATIVVRTHESLSRNVRRDTVRVFVDLSKAKKGEGTFPIRKDEVDVPYGASVVRIDPSSVKIFFEETVSRKVPIIPDVAGAPENGYYVKSIEINPSEMVLEGAKSAVRRAGAVKTEPIDITGMTEDFRQDVALKLPDSSLRAKTVKVAVHIRIARRGK